MKKLSGSFVAIVTPFKKGKVDFKALQKLVVWHLKSGTHGFVPCGTTGESPTLSHDEHKKVIAAVVEVARGKAQVIAGAGSNSTDEAIGLTAFAKKAGADAVLSVVPYYNKPTQEGQFRHFAAIAKKVDIPVVLYNIPGRCGVGLAPKTIARLSKIENIVAVKEATGSMDQTSEILAECDIAVLSGDDSLTLPLMSLGATGVISVFANLFPRDLASMVNAFAAGNLGGAMEWHYKIFALCRTLFVETNPIPVKAAMKMLGLDSGEVRLPLCQMSAENKAALQKALNTYVAARGGKN